jgi:RHS repeat-associated protein
MKASPTKSNFRILLFACLALLAGISWQLLQRKDQPLPQPPPVATNQPEIPATAPVTQPIPTYPLDQSPFSTPLLSTGEQNPAPADQAALQSLFAKFTAMGGSDNFATAKLLGDFLTTEKSSPFALSLLQEKAAIEWRHGYFSASLASIRQAWALGADLQEINQRRLAEAALSTLLNTLSHMGSREDLRALIASLKDRPLGGAATEALSKGKEQLWFFDNQPEQNVFCGFTAANTINVPAGKPPIFPDVHSEKEKKEFIANGLSLFELRAHNHEAGGDFRILKASAKTDLPVPSIVHWKFGHYSSITERSGDLYRVKDVHLKYDSWVPRDAIETEGSGYFLASADVGVPRGFGEINDTEAKSVFGRHCVHGREPEGDDMSTDNGSFCPIPPPPPLQSKPKQQPMAYHSFRLVNPGLEIKDTPISYTAPYGPGVNLTIKYDQRSPIIPDVTSHANFGPRWTHDYHGFVNLVGTGTPSASVQTIFGNGTFFNYSYSTATGTYLSKYQSRPKLEYIAPASGGPGYRLLYANGRELIYKQPNSATPTRYYLSSIRDPRGNALTFGYDATLRLTTLTDAVGQITTFSYTPAADDLVQSDVKKIRAIIDPFGRTASFRYTATGLLHKIIDPVGIVSEFRYAATGDFIDRLTTPYGNHTYTWGDLPGINDEPGRFIEATDPYGDKERVEANDYSGYPAGGFDPNPAPTSITVAGQAIPFLPKTDNLFFRNTFYWNKKQMKEGAGDFSKAMLYNWKADNDVITGIIGSAQVPLEGRVWYQYPGQTSAEGLGTHQQPSKIVRAVEKDGALVWTMVQNDYDATWGLPSRNVDSLGRETLYEYNPAGTVAGAVTGRDITAIKVKNGAGYDTLATFADYEFQQPRTVTDAAGQITRYVYNAFGQVTTVTNAKNEVTTFTYYPADDSGKRRKGRLQQIDGALAGSTDIVSFDYDFAGRVARVTGPDGYYLDYLYDNIDRLTRVTYPDATYTETIYQRLDPLTSRDRLGRLTTYAYNDIRQLASVTDPANRTIQYRWCKCGDLSQLIDAMGRLTRWRHDVAGRVTAKEYNDGSKIIYAYENLSGRLSSITDEKMQVKTRRYNLDGTVAGIAYTNEEHETPDVSFTYETPYRRLQTMLDGIGTTTYGYHPVTPGTLGAGQLATVDGPWANDIISYGYDPLGRMLTRAIDGVAETATFDPAGRLSTITNALGAFTYLYDGATPRLTSATHSGGVKSVFSYFPNNQDRRLQKISNLKPDGVTPLSVFDYTYDAHGRIRTWKQQQDNAAATAQLWTLGYDDADQLTSNVVTQGAATVSTSAWAYDKAGNRTSETINGVTTTATHNALNELIATTAALPPVTYEWDAENRLIAINQGTKRSEFTFDGLGRRVKLIEKESSLIVQRLSYLFDGLQLRETRDNTGSLKEKRFFSQGFQSELQVISKSHLYTKNHLGSISESSNLSGIIIERLRYDPWGRVSSSLSTVVSSFAFTGHYYHSPSGLLLAPYRAYSSQVGRWISQDPIKENGGINLYKYAENEPIGRIDKLGLYTLGEAEESLKKNGVSKGDKGTFYDSYTETQIFDEWMRLEQSDTKWLNELPSCPELLADRDPTQWGSPSDALQSYHPNATTDLRSNATPGGHGSQCSYDAQGRIMRDAPAAGTADRAHGDFTNVLNHRPQDVIPYNLAEKLNRISDYYLVRPVK